MCISIHKEREKNLLKIQNVENFNSLNILSSGLIYQIFKESKDSYNLEIISFRELSNISIFYDNQFISKYIFSKNINNESSKKPPLNSKGIKNDYLIYNISENQSKLFNNKFRNGNLQNSLINYKKFISEKNTMKIDNSFNENIKTKTIKKLEIYEETCEKTYFPNYYLDGKYLDESKTEILYKNKTFDNSDITIKNIGFIEKGGNGGVFKVETNSKYYVLKIGKYYKNDISGPETEIKTLIKLMDDDNRYKYTPEVFYISKYEEDNFEVYFILMEYFEDVIDLYTYFFKCDTEKKLSDIEAILINLVIALYDLQEKGVIHGDIKPENILVNLKTNFVLLIDFGWSYFTVDIGILFYGGTPGYSISIIDNNPILKYLSYYIDWYSFYCILKEMNREKIYFNKKLMDRIFKAYQNEYLELDSTIISDVFKIFRITTPIMTDDNDILYFNLKMKGSLIISDIFSNQLKYHIYRVPIKGIILTLHNLDISEYQKSSYIYVYYSNQNSFKICFYLFSKYEDPNVKHFIPKACEELYDSSDNKNNYYYKINSENVLYHDQSFNMESFEGPFKIGIPIKFKIGDVPYILKIEKCNTKNQKWDENNMYKLVKDRDFIPKILCIWIDEENKYVHYLMNCMQNTLFLSDLLVKFKINEKLCAHILYNLYYMILVNIELNLINCNLALNNILVYTSTLRVHITDLEYAEIYDYKEVKTICCGKFVKILGFHVDYFSIYKIYLKMKKYVENLFKDDLELRLMMKLSYEYMGGNYCKEIMKKLKLFIEE